MEDKSSLPNSYSAFPKHTVSDSEKAETAYGLKVGKAIEYEWFNRGSGRSDFYQRWNDFHLRRLYARAEQPMQKYKTSMAALGDLSYLTLDWKQVPIMPKFVDIVVNGMSERLLKPNVEAVDPMSLSDKSAFQKNIEGQMAAKDLLLDVQDKFNVDPFTMDPNDLPANDEELDLYMQLEYKPSIEIAEEIVIQTILEENNYYELKKRLDYDQVVVGASFVYHDFLPGEGIRIKYVDPASVVHSYTDDPYFTDCFYWGHVEVASIPELYKIKPDLSEDDIEEISKMSEAWYNYHGLSEYYRDNVMKNNSATLLYFSYKTTKTFKYKKKIKNGSVSSYKMKDDDWNPSQEIIDSAGDFEVAERTLDVWYDGILVAGTNILLKWELQENMVKPDSFTRKTLPRYAGAAPRMYNGRIDSLVARMMQFADLIQLTHLKLQQVVAKVVPDGVYIDADGLANVDLGDGGEYDPQKALQLYFQTGSVIGRSNDIDDEFNHGKIPIQELGKNSGSSKIESLLRNYNHYISMMSQVAGLNQATDGSSPDERSLVGVQKIAALNSNTATRHILDAGVSVYKRVCEAVSLRVCDVVKFSPDFAEELVSKIGKYNSEVLRSVKDLHLHSFGIHVIISPDAEQRERLEANIDRALERNDIFLEDAIDVRQIENIKLANQLLKVKRLKKQQREERMAAEKDARAHKMNMAQIQESAKADKVKQQNIADAKIAIANAEGDVAIRKMNEEVKAKEYLMGIEFDYNMRLKGLEVDGKRAIEDKKEDRKDKRQAKQATQQSRMIDQRNKDSKPINFESEEDSLDGFDLGPFDPR